MTQVADPAHPVLGATMAKIHALAERVDEVVVLADRIAPEALPENCRGRSFAAPTQAGRGARYLAALAPVLASRPLAVVAHMSPIFALLAAPLARPLRVPLLLWFTQQGAGRKLAAAERAVDALLSVDTRSVPLRSRKVRAIGHGIDVDAFPCLPEREPPLGRLLGLGRYAPVKRWDAVLRVLPELPEATLTLHGPALGGADREHRAALERLADELGVAARVTFGAEVAYTAVPGLFERADALVNATRGYAADKVVYEAAAACLPVFAASPVFDALLPDERRFDGGDPATLAERIRSYRADDGRTLRARVAASHSAAHWAERVLEAASAGTPR